MGPLLTQAYPVTVFQRWRRGRTQFSRGAATPFLRMVQAKPGAWGGWLSRAGSGPFGCRLGSWGSLGAHSSGGSALEASQRVSSSSLRHWVWPRGLAWKISPPNPRLHFASALLLISCVIWARLFLLISMSKTPSSHVQIETTIQHTARIYLRSFLGQRSYHLPLVLSVRTLFPLPILRH